LTTENFNSFEKIDFQFQLEELLDNFHLLTKIERFILLEKHVKQRSDADIGKALHISGQMVSKKKRKAYAKLRKIFSFQ
ncbi:sigma-70 family RNA polymerase sigma factor, partial [Enterococcus faecalis]|nr:sigma-70 family RNA polymerase sigma factor [Enterococcus faecalis]